MDSTLRNYWLFALALICLAQSPNIIKFSQIPINIFGFWRLLISSFILYGVYILKTSFSKSSQIQTQQKLSPKKMGLIIISGLLFFAHLWTFFFAAKNTQIANAMIIYSVNPLFTALGSFMFFHEKFTWKLFIAYILALLGIFLIFKSGIEVHSNQYLGDAAALLSALLFAAYALISKQIRKKMNNLNFASAVYMVTALCFGVSGWQLQQPFWGYSTVDWLTVGASILIPTLLGHALFSYLLNELSLTKMTLGKLVEPLIASFIAYLIFHEPLQKMAALSFFFIATSIVISFTPIKKGKS